MNFSIVPSYMHHQLNHPHQSNLNFKTNFKKIAEEFCKQYYTTYDTNIHSLSNFFANDVLISFLHDDYIGFSSFKNSIIYHYHAERFIHHGMNVSVQPISDNALVINVNGSFSVNYTYNSFNFTETIVLQQNSKGEICVTNLILKIV